MNFVGLSSLHLHLLFDVISTGIVTMTEIMIESVDVAEIEIEIETGTGKGTEIGRGTETDIV